MQPVILQRLDNGVPGTARIADLSDRAAAIRLGHRAMWGPYSARVPWGGTIEEGFAAAAWLGCPVEFWSMDGEWLWEGLVWSVSFGAGTRTRTRSLDGYANRVTVLWQNADTGEQGTPVVVDDDAAQVTYGIYEYVHNAGRIVAATATALATQHLSLRSRLLYVPDGRGSETPQIEIECAGWYRTLGNQTYISATTGTADIGVVIGNILDTCPLISTDRSQIEVTGADTLQTFDAYETPLEIIRRLVEEAGDYVFGLGPGRVPYLRPSNRLGTSPHYIEDQSSVIRDPGGAEVAPWQVRADRVLRQIHFVPAYVPTAAIDSIESVYLAEVEYSVQSGLDYSASVTGPDGSLYAF
jgi:hypothetical protein